MRQFFVNCRITQVLKSLSGIVIMVLNDNDVSLICLINDDGIVIRQGLQSIPFSTGEVPATIRLLVGE